MRKRKRENFELAQYEGFAENTKKQEGWWWWSVVVVVVVVEKKERRRLPNGHNSAPATTPATATSTAADVEAIILISGERERMNERKQSKASERVCVCSLVLSCVLYSQPASQPAMSKRALPESLERESESTRTI